MPVSALRYCSSMFDVTLTPNTLPASLEAARRRLEHALADAEALAPLVLGRREAHSTLRVCADFRACAEELMQRVVAPGELLSSDELVGRNRGQLKSGLDNLLMRFLALALTAQNLADELRKQVRSRASA
jgi:hypothetical protein